MPTEFAYVQARAQARHGDRLSEESWRLLGSSRGLSNYLHTVRSTALAPHVQHFSASSSPHMIERSLRHDWSAEVATASHWVPEVWRVAVQWATWLPYLPLLAHLLDGKPPLPWMLEDALLADFESHHDARRLAAGIAPPGAAWRETKGDLLESWLIHWQTLWPPTDATGRAGLMALLALLRRASAPADGAAPGRAENRQRRRELEMRTGRMLRLQGQQPVTVFCHLLLSASELLRLREGLLRRALYNDVAEAGRP